MHNENMEEIKSISMQNVTFSYKGKKRYVFEDFSVDIEPNHITGIIGRNGQGKTTLMNLIAGKFEPDEGIIEIDGKNPVTDIGTAKRIVYVSVFLFSLVFIFFDCLTLCLAFLSYLLLIVLFCY